MNLLLLIPSIPFGGALLAFATPRYPRLASQLTSYSIGLCLLLTIFIASYAHLPDYQLTLFYLTGNQYAFGLGLDHLSLVMLLLVSTISFLVHRYASRYLAADPTQARFMAQLSLVTTTVIIFVMSDNLFTAFIGWQLIGVTLYVLLNHYHYDMRANRAAKKKFIINRLGDMSFLMAVILCFLYYDTSNFNALGNIAAAHIQFPRLGISVNEVIALLIFVAVMTKSAQFPFHIWLPDTMETPTPVSALMHAGIINAGGFLLTRLAPLLLHSSLMMSVIFVSGLTTSIVGGWFMQTQADAKKQLAYSTMGQMGYMLMQCGLGCFSAAIFHLIAHSFYKASLFLNVGSAIHAPLQVKRTHRPQQRILATFFALILGSLIVIFGYWWIDLSIGRDVINHGVLAFIIITLTYYCRLLFLSRLRLLGKLLILCGITGLYFVYLYSVNGIDFLLKTAIVESNLNLNYWQTSLVAGIIITQLILWCFPKQHFFKTQLYRRLYALSYHKLYIEPLLRRFILYPLRRLGDSGNVWLHIKQSKFNTFLRYGLFFFVMTTTLVGFYNWIDAGNLVQPLLLETQMAFFLLFLVIADRTKTLQRLFYYLLMAELAFMNLGLYIADPLTRAAAAFHLINILFVFMGLALLVWDHKRNAALMTIETNALPWLSIYLTSLLFLLLGIPCTASFFIEFLLIKSLVIHSPWLAIAIAVGVIFLAIALLHTVQEHVFSPTAFNRLNPRLSLGVHVFCLTAIAINIFNGLYPALLFRQLMQLSGAI